LFCRSQQRRAEEPRRPAGAAQEADADNVVRAHPLAGRLADAPTATGAGLFSAEEEAFLANAIDWLRARPDPDILLDALTRAVLPQETAEDAEDMAGAARARDDGDGEVHGSSDETPPSQ
jgi:hypothetical protein